MFKRAAFQQLALNEVNINIYFELFVGYNCGTRGATLTNQTGCEAGA